MIDRDMVAAWRKAGAQLEIRVFAPYQLELADGAMLDVEAYLPDFGSSQGSVMIDLTDESRCRLAVDTTYFVSQLSSSYRRFDIDHFLATLNDLGWFGSPDDRPGWYSGEPWSK